jgi:hypothetical protein
MHLTDRLGTDKRENIMSIPELPRVRDCLGISKKHNAPDINFLKGRLMAASNLVTPPLKQNESPLHNGRHLL